MCHLLLKLGTQINDYHDYTKMLHTLLILRFKNLSRLIDDRKEGNVLFNNALNTLYLRLYGVGHMVKDHSDSERGNHIGYSFQLSARVLLYTPSQAG